MEQKLNELLRTIDFYCEMLENSEVLKKVDGDNMRKIFQTCIFIENAVKKIEEENKEIEFESHLNAWMLKKNKTIAYKCSNFKNACDKMLELFLKEETISNEIIDDLLKLYIHECGNVRLEACINQILTNSMQVNAILGVFKNMEFPKTDIENEVLIASWENEIKIGKRKKVIVYLTDMFEREHISKLIDMAYKSITTSPVNCLILDFFTKKLIDNDILLYSELKDAKKKVLLKLLMDHAKFQVSFIDTTFYIGRNMEPDEEEQWVTETGFTYDDLKKMIKVLLNGPEELYTLITNRVKLAKELDEVWEDIEKDCIL